MNSKKSDNKKSDNKFGKSTGKKTDFKKSSSTGDKKRSDSKFGSKTEGRKTSSREEKRAAFKNKEQGAFAGKDRPRFRDRDKESSSFGGKERGSFRRDEIFEKRTEEKEFVYGRHPVSEALDSNIQINKIWIDENFKDTRDLFDKIKKTNIPYQLVNKAKLNNLVGEEANHQGIVASISEKEYTELHDLLELAKTKEVFFVILDKVEDPHNLGAIIRTADATGVDAIIIPKHGAVGITGVVSKTSAGALARMKVCRVTNLSQTIEKLKEVNVWVASVDMEGKDIHTKANLKGNIAILLGGEGKGVSKVLSDNCDFSIKIPMKAYSNSLNVSVATAVICYEVFRQRDFK